MNTRTKVLSLCLSLFLVFPFLSFSVSATSFPDKYDERIKRATRTYLPHIPYELYKAQLFQESRLDPNAVSPAGATGLAQFMPGTWGDVRKALALGSASAFEADASIVAGAYYMRSLTKQWSSPRTPVDRHNLAMASYNAGLGNILAAQQRCGMATPYKAIIACLPDITGRHSKETITYVDRIWHWFKLMMIGG